MNKISEEYKELIGEKQIRLTSIEDRGDDLATSMSKDYKYDDLTLFLLSLKTAPDGFIEKFCLEKDNKKRLKEIRSKIDNDKNWKNNIITELEQYLPIPYIMFMYFQLDRQLEVIEAIKHKLDENDLEEFNSKFNRLIEAKYEQKESNYETPQISYRVLIGNAFYAKNADYLEYKDITKYKEILFKIIVEKYKFIMFEQEIYDFVEIKNSLLIKEKDGIRIYGRGKLDEATIESINSIYPEDIQELIKKSREIFVEKNKQLIKK